MASAAAATARGVLVILGGNGFVGTAVAQEALARGLNVLCLSRSGEPAAPQAAQPWAKQVQWGKADAFSPDSYREALASADALVVSIGSPPVPFVDYDFQRRMNGESNVRGVGTRQATFGATQPSPVSCSAPHTPSSQVVAAHTAKEAGVPMLVLVNASMPPLLVPKGYRDGKHDAEAAARAFVDGWHGAAVLKPGAIHGVRYVNGRPLNISPLLAPASWGMRLVGLGANAPVGVRHVAAAAVSAVTDKALRGKYTEIDNKAILAHAPQLK